MAKAKAAKPSKAEVKAKHAAVKKETKKKVNRASIAQAASYA